MNEDQRETKYKPKNNGTFIVGVMFRNNRNIYDYKTNLPLNVGDKCIVESKNLEEFATIFSFKRNVLHGKVRRPLKFIIRKATEKDNNQIKKNKGLEKEAGIFFNETIKKKGLKIKFVSVSFSFNSKKAIFNYTSDQGRIDIKDIIRELADNFKIRIELKQIGMRDAARLLGVCGLCGKKLCCTSFLKEFQPVSIKMAKDQEIPLSPMKISGICNRLLCCLGYEHSTYKELKKGMPKCGQCVSTKNDETGTVVKRNILKEEVTIKTNDDKFVKADIKDITVLKKDKNLKQLKNKPNTEIPKDDKKAQLKKEKENERKRQREKRRALNQKRRIENKNKNKKKSIDDIEK